jgi:hypothetical protein
MQMALRLRSTVFVSRASGRMGAERAGDRASEASPRFISRTQLTGRGVVMRIRLLVGLAVVALAVLAGGVSSGQSWSMLLRTVLSAL